MTDRSLFAAKPLLRVAARWFAGDFLPHLYRVSELDDETINFLQPPAHANPYHDYHPRTQLSAERTPAPAALTDTCPTCDRWIRQNPDTVVMHGNTRI